MTAADTGRGSGLGNALQGGRACPLAFRRTSRRFNAHRNLMGTQNQLSTAMERLSSGFRINRAADDAAGLAISREAPVADRWPRPGARNAQDAVSLVQTGEGAMAEVQSMLQRVRDLAVQFNNGTLSASDKAAITAEVAQLCAEVSDIGSQTQFNGINLLTGGATITFQVGSNDGQTIAVSAVKLFGAARATRSTRRCSASPARSNCVDRRGDPERVQPRSTFGVGAEPPRSPPEQPGDLRGEPPGLGELDQGRRHGVGDDQVHPAPDPAAGRHGNAGSGERSATVGAQAARVVPPALPAPPHTSPRAGTQGDDSRAIARWPGSLFAAPTSTLRMTGRPRRRKRSVGRRSPRAAALVSKVSDAQ